MDPKTWRKLLETAFPFLKVAEKPRKARTRLFLEPLEDRWVPATINVTGFADHVGAIDPIPGGSNSASILSAPDLRTAVAWADQVTILGSTSTINLPGSATHYTLNGTNGELLVNGNSGGVNLTIQTNGGNGMAIIDGQSSTRLFEVGGPSGPANTLNLISLELANGKVTGSLAEGGAILNNHNNTVKITKSLFLGNEADGDSLSGGSVGTSKTAGSAEGGAIFNDGDLCINDSTFTGNFARGGSVSYGHLPGNPASNFFLRGGDALGGALYLSSQGAHVIKITGSTFADNQADGGTATHTSGSSGGEGIFGGFAAGGAIFRQAGLQDLTIANSTFAKTFDGTGNIAQGGNAVDIANLSNRHGLGGGSEGGAIAIEVTDLTSGSIHTLALTGPSGSELVNFTNDTVADNHAVAGIGNLTPSGPSGPSLGVPAGGSGGGGIYVAECLSSQAPQILNTLVARNTADKGPDVFGPFNSQGHNLINKYDASVAPGFSSLTPKFDILGGSEGVPNLNLDTDLRKNGGPTQTLALLTGSVAIDRADNKVVLIAPPGLSGPLTTDQRDTGYARLSNFIVDIGAFEVQQPALAPVYTFLGSLTKTVLFATTAANGLLHPPGGPTLPTGHTYTVCPVPVSLPALGTLTTPLGTDGSFSYTSRAGTAYTTTFRFKVKVDGIDYGLIFTATINVTVGGRGSAPR